METDLPDRSIIVEDFRQARRKAPLNTVLARIRGENAELLSYEDVIQQLQGRELPGRELRQIPLDAVVGSVARYKDFTRTFLPKGDSQRDRWSRIKLLMTSSGLPPIEVYDIDGNYFVKDGNHRVSVAREMELETIEAYVTPVVTRIPLAAMDDANSVILQSEHAEFLAHTQLDHSRPDSVLQVSVPSAYRELLEHIDVHRHFMGNHMQRTIPYQEAAAHWHDEVYLPVKELIAQHNLLAEFPGRTEADLYLWITRHKCELQEYLGWDVPEDAVVEDLLMTSRPADDPANDDADNGLQHLGKRLRSLLRIAGDAGTGDRTGDNRRRAPDKADPPPADYLLETVLTLIDGEEGGWEALARALELGQIDRGQIVGLMPVAPDGGIDAEAATTRFRQTCDGAGLRHVLLPVDRELDGALTRHSRLADMFVFNVNARDDHGMTRWTALESVMNAIACPMLILRGQSNPIRRVLLISASGEAPDESLCTACYMAARAQVSFEIVVLKPGGGDHNTAGIRGYLQDRGFTDVAINGAPELEDVLALLIRRPVDCIMMRNGQRHARPNRRPERRRGGESIEQRLLTKIDTPVLLF